MSIRKNEFIEHEIGLEKVQAGLVMVLFRYFRNSTDGMLRRRQLRQHLTG